MQSRRRRQWITHPESSEVERMDLGIVGKVALITGGGGGGVGRAVSLAFAGEGLAVAVVDRAEEAALKVAEEVMAAGGRPSVSRLTWAHGNRWPRPCSRPSIVSAVSIYS